MKPDWPIVIAMTAALVVTGIAAWILKFFVDLGHAVHIPKEKP